MNVRGGRRTTLMTCAVALATLTAACSGDSKPEIEATITPGGGQTSGVSSGFTSLDGLFAGPSGAGIPGLSVRGTATGTVPADLAFVVISPSISDLDLSDLGNAGVSAADRKAVLAGLSGLGVAASDVSFGAGRPLGDTRLQVKVPLAQLAARGPKIVASVERTLGRSRSSGASYSVANCDPAAGPIRKQAMQQAEGQAKAMADAGKLNLGGVVAISSDGVIAAGLPGGGAPEGCPLVESGQVVGFDAKPEVRLSVGVNVTYAIAGAPATGSSGRPLLWAGGSATAKAKADEAYVLVVYSSEDGEPTGGPSAADRTRVLEALDKLKVDRKDVQIISRSDYGVTTVVQVETKAAGLENAAKDILRAVEDVLGRSDTNGARFWSSTCTGLLAKVRKDAVADARQRANSLAEAAGVKLGVVEWISEATPTGADPCDGSVDALLALDDYSSSPLAPFDAEPEFVLTTAAQLGFHIN